MVRTAEETDEGVWWEETGCKVGKAAVSLGPGLLCSPQRGLVWHPAWTPWFLNRLGAGISAFSRQSRAKGLTRASRSLPGKSQDQAPPQAG